jgi:hypothetical protein
MLGRGYRVFYSGLARAGRPERGHVLIIAFLAFRVSFPELMPESVVESFAYFVHPMLVEGGPWSLLWTS